MRHKYDTRGIVLARSPVGEASAFLTLLTPELGIVRALAQSVRKPGAKLSAALATFTESSVVLVRGRDGWRLSGAVLEENWFPQMTRSARVRAARVSGLLLRLAAGEARDTALFPILHGFFESLAELSEEEYEAVEILTALRILSALGLDAGEIPGDASVLSSLPTTLIGNNRLGYITRINDGIAASGL
ncbi:MAG: recombination protein O N-terminal domain-containing protein [Patescibacteria group bacterium]|nr:recombination protein O N-terminal domain-containing protein [Patescibacteria group bacterium]